MFKKIERLKYMDYLIRIEGTGDMEEFARKMSISHSTCGEYIKILRGMGAKIDYCRYKNTYKYSEPVEFFIGYKNLPENYMIKVTGGKRDELLFWKNKIIS